MCLRMAFRSNHPMSLRTAYCRNILLSLRMTALVGKELVELCPMQTLDLNLGFQVPIPRTFLQFEGVCGAGIDWKILKAS